jgi:hypothetical protein
MFFRARGDKDALSQQESTEIWLRHDGNGDSCEGYLTETRQMSVSRRALETVTVVLLTPDGTEIPLR